MNAKLILTFPSAAKQHLPTAGGVSGHNPAELQF